MKKLAILLFCIIFYANSIFAVTEYETGLKAYNQGNYAFAKTLFIKALNLNPNDLNSRYMLSQVYIKEKNYNAAKQEYQKIIRLAPNSQAGQYAKKGLQYIDEYYNKPATTKVAPNNTQKNVQTQVKNTNQIKPQAQTKSQVSNLPKSQIQSGFVITPNQANNQISYYYYVPSNLKNSSGYPIIFHLPGLGGDGKGMLYGKNQDFADKNGFAIASITFKFNQEDFNKEQSYQYPNAWSGKAFKDVLAKIKKDGVSFGDVYMVGFSAGGQFASRFAVQNPGFLKGCAILSSGARVIPDKPNNTKFFFAVGENDDQYRRDNQSKFVEGAKNQNINVTGKVYSKLGHATSPEEENDVERFILKTSGKN